MIEDHGYGWLDDPRMQRLTPRRKVQNAGTFANFAFEAARGQQSSKP